MPAKMMSKYPSNRKVIRRDLRRGRPDQIWKRGQQSYRSHLPKYGDVDDVLEQARTEDLSLVEMADLSTGTGGILNVLFGGRTVWAQLNLDSFAYGSMPKVDPSTAQPYGWRAKTAFASTGRGGQSEGTVPNRVTADYFEVEPTIKEHSTHMGVSGLQQDLVEIDDAYGAIADIQDELGDEHTKEHERAIMTDTATLSGNNLESIDRVTFSNQAAIDLTGYTADQDEDIHNIDRSVESWADAVIDYNDASDRNLTLDRINDALQQVRENGGNTTFFLTGWDTWVEFSNLIGDQGRFDMEVQDLVGASLNEADVPEGLAISTFVNHYQGRPIVPSDEAPVDGISRIYGLDIENPDGKPTPNLGVHLVKPTQVWTAGERTQGAPQQTDFLGDTALATTRHELVCRFFKAQLQVRDLKAQ